MSNPQVPNPDQLQFINPKADPRTNPARYEEAPPDEVKPPVPVITLGPNAVYLVQPGYWEEKAEDINLPEPPEPPVVEPPTLSSLEPNELPVWAADTEVFWNGTNFTEDSKIIWNNAEEPTKFIDSGRLSTTVRPSTISVTPPFPLETYVVDNGQETDKLTFTFIA